MRSSRCAQPRRYSRRACLEVPAHKRGRGAQQQQQQAQQQQAQAQAQQQAQYAQQQAAAQAAQAQQQAQMQQMQQPANPGQFNPQNPDFAAIGTAPTPSFSARYTTSSCPHQG